MEDCLYYLLDPQKMLLKISSSSYSATKMCQIFQTFPWERQNISEIWYPAQETRFSLYQEDSRGQSRKVGIDDTPKNYCGQTNMFLCTVFFILVKIMEWCRSVAIMVSCGCWTLFLCKHFSRFSCICKTAGHVSENSYSLSYYNSKVQKCLPE